LGDYVALWEAIGAREKDLQDPDDDPEFPEVDLDP
jgi:hypothetical protein